MRKKLTYFIYILIIVSIFSFLFWIGHFKGVQDFYNRIEQSSFDVRQSFISNYKKPNKDIVILSVDDATYEYIMDKYGQWPITRGVWSNIIENIEKANPKAIAFDLLFIKPNLKEVKGDLALIQSVKKHQNVYLPMTFDYYSADIRKPSVLDDKFKLKITNGDLKDNHYTTYTNSTAIMKGLMNATDNIGVVNVTRDNDGIMRALAPVFKYHSDYYPNLSLKVAMDYLNVNSIEIKNNKIILDKDHQMPIDSTNRVILNWYGPSHTYLHIPVWEVLKAIKENNQEFIKNNFENKIVYIGTTAISLYDIKSTPVDYNMAGVETHATFLNNILDNNFIKKTDYKYDFIVSLIIAIVVGYIVLKTSSVPKTFVALIAIIIAYWGANIFLMHQYNLWCSFVLPSIIGIMTFVLVYCEKYILKTKDYEQTYKLAVTDGLTQLFNHRYFQEQMSANISNFERYGNKFSLILIDIDFFKKFNDTYGHQSGDAVLIQVANILKKNSRTSDIVCRYGGEEMSIILTNTNKKEAIITANKICFAVRNNQFTLTNNKKVNVTISVGVATVGENGKTPQEMIEYSDKCLYKAKEQGRDQVVFEV